jgi:hypothetical protein
MELEDSASPIRRLITLVAAGYRIDEDASKSVGDCVWLEHLSPKARHKTVFLYEGGLLVGLLAASDDQLRIANHESDEFARFVASVPSPTWWDHNCKPFYMVAAWALIGGFGALVLVLTNALWNFVREFFT